MSAPPARCKAGLLFLRGHHWYPHLGGLVVGSSVFGHPSPPRHTCAGPLRGPQKPVWPIRWGGHSVTGGPPSRPAPGAAGGGLFWFRQAGGWPFADFFASEAVEKCCGKNPVCTLRVISDAPTSSNISSQKTAQRGQKRDLGVFWHPAWGPPWIIPRVHAAGAQTICMHQA